MQINLYVDNLITGCDTENAAADYYKEARAIMSSGKFNLCSWSSNSNRLTVWQMPSKTMLLMIITLFNILGLRWDPTTDLLSLVAKPFILTNNHLVTKREVLQATAKIFDRLGFISPVVYSMSQDFLTDVVASWDEPLNNDLAKDWTEIASDLKQSLEFTVQRRYFQAPHTQLNVCQCKPEGLWSCYLPDGQ